MQLISEHKPRLELALLPETDPAGLPALRTLIADMYAAEARRRHPSRSSSRTARSRPSASSSTRSWAPGDIVLAEEITWPASPTRSGCAVARCTASRWGRTDSMSTHSSRRSPAAARARGAQSAPPEPDGLAAPCRRAASRRRTRRPVRRAGDRGPRRGRHLLRRRGAADSRGRAGGRPDHRRGVGVEVGVGGTADRMAARRPRARAPPARGPDSSPTSPRACRGSCSRSISSPAPTTSVGGEQPHPPGAPAAAAGTHGRAPARLEVEPPRGGLSLWVRVPAGSAAALARVAATHGVSIAGSEAFAVSVSPDDHIRIPFTAPDDVLAEGIRRLGAAWREYRETLASSPVITRSQ